MTIHFLSWTLAGASAGQVVYAAGIDRLSKDFVLARGVSKGRTDWGDTRTAAPPVVILHDAALVVGAIGGPLLAEDGRVVGISYGLSVLPDHAYAISSVHAVDLVEIFKTGEYVAWIGIAGSIALPSAPRAGMHILSVSPGSPAGALGLEPRDIILSLDGTAVGRHGSAGVYCDVLAGHNSGDPIAIEIYRPSEAAVFIGALNDPLSPLDFAPPDS